MYSTYPFASIKVVNLNVVEERNSISRVVQREELSYPCTTFTHTQKKRREILKQKLVAWTSAWYHVSVLQIYGHSRMFSQVMAPFCLTLSLLTLTRSALT